MIHNLYHLASLIYLLVFIAARRVMDVDGNSNEGVGLRTVKFFILSC